MDDYLGFYEFEAIFSCEAETIILKGSPIETA